MKMTRLISILFALGSLLLLFGCGNSVSSQQQVPFSSLKKGEASSGGITPGQAQTSVMNIIRNDTEWANFWNLLYLDNAQGPPPSLVNFNESVVVAVVDGLRSTGGYSITITSILPTSTGITVNAQQVSPGASCLVTQSFTKPFHIVTVPAFSGEATLVLSQSVYNCGQ